MAITVSGTSITFNDSTVQTTAAGAIPANLAVGCVCILYNFARAGVIHGNNASTANLGYATNTIPNPYGPFGSTARAGNATTAGAGLGLGIYVNTATPTGTWRALGSVGPSSYSQCSGQTSAPSFLAVRIA
jgi:hypothetical protein